jgi:uncharacterized sporulation protein YeaH/YhbH (DUF444 family)
VQVVRDIQLVMALQETSTSFDSSRYIAQSFFKFFKVFLMSD